MVTTRGIKRTLTTAFPPAKKGLTATIPPLKQRPSNPKIATASTSTAPSPKKKKKSRATSDLPPAPPLLVLSEEEVKKCTTIPYPRLPFDLSQGKDHLLRADPRFGPLLDRIPLRVFEELTAGDQSQVKELDLFKTLVTSILGQQVSWLAARAILYKFIRLFYADSLPVTPDFEKTPRDSLPFPTPLQVRALSEETLRTAGLSGMKCRYVLDISSRFSDGRLDVRALTRSDRTEEDIIQDLVQIKGVGVWTAQMLLLFALRKPDVLPVGDLGVQRGVVLFWASDEEGPAITSKKARPIEKKEEQEVKREVEAAHRVEDAVHEAEAPAHDQQHPLPLPSKSSVKQEAVRSIPSLPPAAGLTMSQLQARKNGHKTKGNVYLSPSEMEALTDTWKPFRSLASVLMWALVDA